MDRSLKLLTPFNSKLPVILQVEAAECGLACLAMIMSYYGHKIDLASLRRRFPITLRGSTLGQLMQTGHALGLSSRPLQLELSQIKELTTPSILHWEFNHFVVLRKVNRKGIIINDPASGKRNVSWDEVSRSFTGVALELTPTTQFEKKDETVQLKFSQLWSHIGGFTSSFISILLLSLVLQVFAIISPLYMQTVVDEVVISGDESLLVALATGFAILAIITAVTAALRSLSILLLSSQLAIQISSNLFHHLIRLPLVFFERRHMGDIISRFQSLDHVREQMSVGLIEAVVDGIMIIGTLIMMLIYSLKLSAIVLSAVALYFITRLLWYRPIKLATEEEIVASAKKESHFMETVRAIKGIRLFEKAYLRESSWKNLFTDELNSSIKLGRLQVLSSTSNQLIFGLESILVVYFGAISILNTSLSVGMLFAFVSYKSQFTGKASNLIDKLIQFRMLRLHMNRIADIALEKTEEPSAGVALTETSEKGEVELRDVSFKYSENDPVLFENVNLTINPGESVAIIGPSGSGKSSLFKLLLGILPFKKGNIFVDGKNVNQTGFSNIRNYFSTVLQDDQLLTGSVEENISFFDEKIDRSKVIACAKIAVIHEDIESMPMGYNTLIAEMGSSLSGGQIQRVLLARALYHRPKVLLLDEATAHLDIKLEKEINTNIKKLSCTRIFIAHRPETISYADRVFELVDKKLIELKLD